MTILHRASNGDVDTVDVVEKEIEPGNGSEASAGTTGKSETQGVVCQYVNLEQNSRLGLPLPASRWKVRWSAELRERNIPRHILQIEDRIVVESPVWELFDMEGTELWALAAGMSPLNLDPEHGYIYLIDRHGYLVGCRLSDGNEVFSTLPLFGDEFVRPFIGRRGNTMVVVGVERHLDPHGHFQPTRSIIELIDLGDSLEVSATGLLLSARNVASLILETTVLVVAGSGDRLVVAVPDHLYTVDGDLKIVSAYEGRFFPIAISLDEAGRTYLAVRTETGNALWIISPEGKRLQSIDLPPDITTLDAPPVIGYDHKVYLQGAGRILAFGADGAALWEYRPAVKPGGMMATPDNRLLVSAGSDLCVFNEDGGCMVIETFEEERLATAPIITGNGDILVATEENLYALMIDMEEEEGRGDDSVDDEVGAGL